MAFKSLSHFVTALESAGELSRISEFVSPHLEITEITDRIVKNRGKALLFENTGTDFPVLINAFGSESRMSLALGVKNLDEIGEQISRLLNSVLGRKETFLEKLKVLPAFKEMASFFPRHLSGKGSCQEVVFSSTDLTKLPILTCWPADGGAFITLPVVHTKDPLTGIRNTGMYRMQVLGPDTTGMHWHLHKGAAQHFRKYRDLGIKMPVSVTLGGDPAYTYVATAPLPENVDEYLLAGFLRHKKVDLVKCLTNNLEVPEDADFVIEGFIDPGENLILEGPFGDHTGFYSLADYYPRFHITCISHRKNAIYPATIVGIPPMEDEWLGKATERIFLVPIKAGTVPEIIDMNMPVEGVFHNIAVASIDKSFPGQGMKSMNALWGAGQMMFNKIMIIVDKNVNVQDPVEVARTVSAWVDPLQDLQFVKGPVDVLDHSSHEFALGSKIGIDATRDLEANQTGTYETVSPGYVHAEELLNTFPEISAINAGFLSRGISLVVFSFRKSHQIQMRVVCRKAINDGLIMGVKFILLVDPEVDTSDIGMVVWICSNNIDPMRDCFFVNDEDDLPIPSLFVDGTRKTGDLDNFQRDWPNIIVMDDKTIREVDESWNRYNLGPAIPSPSLKYKSLVGNEGAVRKPVP